jgi:uncharacterized protein (TIGR03118 family)
VWVAGAAARSPISADRENKEASMKRNPYLSALCAALLVFSVAPLRAAEKNSYKTTILVTNEDEEADEIPLVDHDLVNAWGLAASPTGPWWVANNGTNTSTLYNGAGEKIDLTVTVPGAPTGEVYYGGTEFRLSNGGPARFIWVAEDGTFSAWNFGLGTSSEIIFNDPGSIYKGLAVHGDVIYTTDFTECEVEAFAGNPGEAPLEEAELDGDFEDDSIPANYCPFGIQAVGDSIFVTYALKGGEDDLAGQGHGFVREFDTEGNLVAQVANHGQLNSPWGVAPAPSDFGRFSGCLLVGNFGDGRINAYCKDEEGDWHFGGQLREGARPLAIDGLWGIGFGNDGDSGDPNVLYFTAGPDEEENGYFGKIEVAN